MSDLTGWVILAIYFIGWIAFVPVIAKFLFQGVTGGDGDGTDRVFSVVLGMVIGIFWPIAIPGTWFYRRIFPSSGER